MRHGFDPCSENYDPACHTLWPKEKWGSEEMSHRIFSSQDSRRKGKAVGKVLKMRTLQVAAQALHL